MGSPPSNWELGKAMLSEKVRGTKYSRKWERDEFGLRKSKRGGRGQKHFQGESRFQHLLPNL